MAYKCKICGSNEVEHLGDICELCAIGQDPYAAAMQKNGFGSGNSNQDIFQSGGQTHSDIYVPGRGKSRKVLVGSMASILNTGPDGNSIPAQSEQEDSVQVYRTGQAAVNTASPQTAAPAGNNRSGGNGAAVDRTMPLTCGITKNITVDMQKKSALSKLFRTLFQGIPYTIDNDITMFQVFPDYSGTSLNAMGNACDQVIVYGKLNAGAVSENNDVEVYGHRDSDNNVVAKKIVNKASGTTITPNRVIPVAVIWAITIVVFALLTVFLTTYGIQGVVWAAVLILCLMNVPVIFKVIGVIIGIIFSIVKRR